MGVREVELIRFDQANLPSDPGVERHRLAVGGLHGAVSFTYMDLRDDAPEDLRRKVAQINEAVSQPVFPLWADIGFHAIKRPPGRDYLNQTDCDLMLGGKCYYDGSSLHAMEVGPAWEATGRDAEWLYRYLADYYHSVFYA